jgi:CopG family transcriptional regulator/antitoxin EndoAI
MHRRLNITLPEETVRLMDRVSKRGGRSRLISEAVRRYVRQLGRTNLRRRLKEGALRRAERDRELAQDWFALEDQE